MIFRSNTAPLRYASFDNFPRPEKTVSCKKHPTAHLAALSFFHPRFIKTHGKSKRPTPIKRSAPHLLDPTRTAHSARYVRSTIAPTVPSLPGELPSFLLLLFLFCTNRDGAPKIVISLPFHYSAKPWDDCYRKLKQRGQASE